MTTAEEKRRLTSPKTSQEAERTTPGHNGDKDSRTPSARAEDSGKKSNKRRKVNHACVYCRRSHMTCDLERPCARCIKRDIGHLCHDEPREPNKRSKSEMELAPAEKTESPRQEIMTGADTFNAYEQGDSTLAMGQPKEHLGNIDAPQVIQPKPLSPAQLQRQPPNENYNMNFDEFDFGAQNRFSDVHNLHPYNTFNTYTSEVTNEYNLLGDFLSSSLLDDGGLYNTDDNQASITDPLLSTGVASTYGNNNASLPPAASSQALAGNEISRPSSAFPIDTKARDKFYMTAADPAGNDTAEERMNKLLKAKYDAGMLKPFNYVKGYARLNTYMERNMRPASRQKILRQLDKFRPKFREAMHNLTDIQLVKVEMWFERSLMEYDRVFASMAIPACCWRRTGEIFRGNKEMAELIHVPIEQLRDVSITSSAVVSTWLTVIIGQDVDPRDHRRR